MRELLAFLWSLLFDLVVSEVGTRLLAGSDREPRRQREPQP